MKSVDSLKESTGKFFELHWNRKSLGRNLPQWSDIWDFYGAMPNNDKQGVYAFIKSGLVTYIGVGAGKGKKGYERYGLGSRVNSKYMRLNREEGRYYAINSKLMGAEGIVTIGFPEGLGYLAVSLEQYLIVNLGPEDNVVQAGG